jgi:alanine racemase
MNQEEVSNWIEVDLDAISGNIKRLKEITGVEVMAVVKANAYGHGLLQAARAALHGGATWLGVARVEEALELRTGHVDSQILVLGYASSEEFEHGVRNNISITLWSRSQVETASRLARKSGKTARVHLKIDTGMSRLGVDPPGVISLVEAIIENQYLEFEGIFTHFARADERDQDSALEQERVFRLVLDGCLEAGFELPLVHAANSAASIYQPSAYFDLVRAGIAVYGLHPSPERPLPDSFKPALTWKSVLSQVKTLPPGRGVSYGHEYVTQKQERIGTVPVGYGDGFRRQQGNKVLVSGKQVPVIGRVCMDQVLVQLDGVPAAQAGDEVVLIGKQGAEHITAEEVAGLWGTINYEVVCGIAARVPRFYQEGH